MASTFFGLNIALQGLYTARAGLDTTAHNIANMDSRGYSRQLVQQRATTPMSLNNGKGMLGTGSEAYGIQQVRDSYIDRKYWSQNSIYGENKAKNTGLQEVESIFNSQSDSSFTSVLNKFYDSFQDLVASDETHLSILRQTANTFTQYFNDAAQKLKSSQENLNFNVRATVDEINSLATQIQGMNGQIYKSELDGSNANDLRDQRAILVDDLSQLINVNAKEDSNGHFRVDIDGQTLVDHTDIRKLETKERKIKEYDTQADFMADTEISGKYTTGTDAEKFAAYQQDCKKYKQSNGEGMFDVYWSSSNAKLDTSNYKLKGTLKGYIDMRDGNNNFVGAEKAGITNSVNYKGIPHYLDEINQFAKSFARLMNEGVSYNGTQLSEKGGFSNGFGLNGNTGIGLFSSKNVDGTYNSGTAIDYDNITAANFSISDEVNTDVKNIATRFNEGDGKDSKDLIESIIALRHDNKAFSQGEISDYMTAVFTEVAINKSQVESFEKGQKNIMTTIDNQRLSVSGVLENEENGNIMKYQHIYTAAAKMIATMDKIYDITINKLGAS